MNKSDIRPSTGLSQEGMQVDITPWTYEWRADRATQPKPEACFIPRRLDRLDKVYRTAYTSLSQQDLKSIYYDQTDLLNPLLPKPKYPLQVGLLWTGGLVDYHVELQWPANAKNIPSPDQVEVRSYPTSFGWFGWTVDRVLSNPQISADGRTWTYKSDPTLLMDSSYNQHIPAATEMIAVFYDNNKPQTKPVIPAIRLVSANVGSWKRMDVEIEWGFGAGTQARSFDGRLESYVSVLGQIKPLDGDKGTTVTGKSKWRSESTGSARRGITVPLLYAPDSRPGLDSRVTVWSGSTGFTFSVKDLNKGPIYIPEHGVFIAKAGSGETAKRFVKELAAKNLKSVREMTREHPEAASWDQLMQEVRLWTCPDGTPVPSFTKGDDPSMVVQVSDERWTDAWCAVTNQLRGKNLWGGLAFEVGRVVHEMDMVGLNAEADSVYDHFLKSPGAKSDGDYLDGDGALEWATAMRHDMGYSHDGTHASTGRLLFAMSERYFLTGDKDWFLKNRDRLQKAADWIIRQRRDYMEDVPNRKDLFVAGLMPPHMLGDYALPACDWHWYYVDEALSVQGLQRFGDALKEFDPAAGRKYCDEAAAYRKDLRKVIDREAVLSPVRLGRDGVYHSFIPRMAYTRGLTGMEIGAPQFPLTDLMTAALPLAEPYAAMDAKDYRMVDTLDMMEEMGTSPANVKEKEDARRQKGLPTEDAWFWNPYIILPKCSHNANIYLLQDDVPNFLRFFFNAYASMTGSDGRLWEHWHLGGYAPCETPDNGTAGWFMENFRDMLVMEDGQSLWVARATPRAWLEQGKKITVKNAPTYFGALAYDIVSDVDNGKITATIEIPSRKPLKSIILRFRHPKAAPIKSVTINGKPWKKFDRDKEVINLTGLQGTATVVANY